MKRDPRLQGLSTEHHHALTLARDVERAAGTWSEGHRAMLRERFDRELQPHFLVEEQLLLPPLRQAGHDELCARLEADHARLRMLAAARDAAAAHSFSTLLREHVRFEERELFPACETLLSNEVLAEVALRAPKRP